MPSLQKKLIPMKAVLLVIGKTDDSYIKEGFDKFAKRIVHYMPFNIDVVPDIKNTKKLSPAQQKEKEGELILQKLQAGDRIVLLDDKGRDFTSLKFADWLNQQMISGAKRLVFIIGGPYGFSDAVYTKADQKISLSKMTFSHQLIRLVFAEQFYRAHTILRNEPYHHE
jgi:23S rRNA (pseudouridine1915-N3)-methyltransferase